MRAPYYAALLTCGLWWTAATVVQAQEAETQPDQATANQLEANGDEAVGRHEHKAADNEANNVRQEERPQVREVDEADEHRAVAPDAGAIERREGMKADEAQSEDHARMGKAARGLALRAETIKGMDVRNFQGEDIGEIEDLLVDAESGKIRYAAISVGGFLGIGDKLIAVPWNRFELRQTGDEGAAEYVLFVNIDKEQLTAARGFDENQWPAFAGEDFGDEQTPRTATEPGETIRE